MPELDEPHHLGGAHRFPYQTLISSNQL